MVIMSAIKSFIINDESQSRSFLRRMLRQYFPEIRVAGEASNVAEGLKGIPQCNPDIVFPDTQMNGETGFDLQGAKLKNCCL